MSAGGENWVYNHLKFMFTHMHKLNKEPFLVILFHRKRKAAGNSTFAHTSKMLVPIAMPIGVVSEVSA